MNILVNNKTLELTDEHFLKKGANWNKDVANSIATLEGLVLSNKHWEIINLLRKFHQEFATIPALRIFIKYMRQELGSDEYNSIYLLKLFPNGPMNQICKIAGLPKPSHCM